MKTTIRILAVLALIQIGLILTTWTGTTKLQSHTLGSLLLSFEPAEIDTLVLKDGKNEIQLEKKDNKWLLADGFPADGKKVAALLSKLTTLQYSLPVATSDQALNRFKVAEDNFERYLQLQSKGKTVAELYLGTGAGARQSHVRNSEQEAVFTVALGSYDLPVTPESWQDKEIMAFDTADVTAIELDKVKLERQPDAENKESSPLWQGESLPPDTTVNQQAVNEGLKKLASLRFSKVLGRKELPEYGLAEPELSLKLLFKNGDRSYTFGKIKDSENICLKVSDREEFFQLASYLAKPLLEKINRDMLVTNTTLSEETGTTETEK
jgi:hypothetical protein